MGISTVVIDSREPKWVQELTFSGVPTAVAALDYGDLHVLCEDDATLIIERKTPDDFLGSLKDDRLFVQTAKCAQARLEAQLAYETMDTIWPYLVITGQFYPEPGGKTITPRGVTGWNWNSVMGALLSIQEMGTAIVFAPNDEEFEHTVIALANRSHTAETQILPPKPPSILSPGHQILASLPGIGLERLKIVMDYAGGLPGWALVGLTDPEHSYKGIPNAVQRSIRAALKLAANERLEIVTIDE
ncbi:MAG: hypothetical protein LLG42_03470 [Chloroflexi bacterium]|nr:hypothetical protein [Chloroflexota bacterium]